ncbi:MAG: protein translocase subunit SecF [Candidatus Caenarcaniphilales bacterium]|nr:protein translocase subunit SecF [Candidatus Caenarcaniphilales bacterium]
MTTSSSNHESPIFSVVERAPLWMMISGTLIGLSLLMIGFSWQKFKAPVRLGLDFTGGSKIEYKFDKKQADLTSAALTNEILPKVNSILASDAIVQVAEGRFLILRTKELSLDDKEKLDKLLGEKFGKFEILSVDTISASIGPELLNSGLLALGLVLVGIMLFVSYRFRRDFAICAIVALLHDVIIVVGLFAALGLYAGIEVNSLFLTACLTVLGFSIHDTIVVFDRIRENIRFVSRKRPFIQIIDESINQVWFRSLCTSLTALIVLGCLGVFGGETTKLFAWAMFAGIVTGTYSSIFVASTLLGQANLWLEKNRVSAPS